MSVATRQDLLLALCVFQDSVGLALVRCKGLLDLVASVVGWVLRGAADSPLSSKRVLSGGNA